MKHRGQGPWDCAAYQEIDLDDAEFDSDADRAVNRVNVQRCLQKKKPDGTRAMRGRYD